MLSSFSPTPLSFSLKTPIFFLCLTLQSQWNPLLPLDIQQRSRAGSPFPGVIYRESRKIHFSTPNPSQQPSRYELSEPLGASVQSAVILATGRGIPLEARGQLKPKACLRFGQKTIVEESVLRLLAVGIKRIVIVTGHLAEHYQPLREQFPHAVELVHNPHFGDSGSMYSLFCARHLLEEDFLLLESDLVYERRALTRHYREFCNDEIHYRVPGGENLHDVAARVQRFFADQPDLLNGPGIHLIVGHRNLNKMILKHLLGLSFEEGFRVEQEHQRLYLFFGSPAELWSCWIEAEGAILTPGYVTTMDDSYA